MNNSLEVRERITPLAEKMRPRSLDEILGQDKVLGKDSSLGRILRDDTLKIPSMLLYGPPGVGKTTIARVIAKTSNYSLKRLSGVLDGVAELRSVVKEAKELLAKRDIPTLIIVDEIHRFNKSQQDAFLPHVESGLLTIIGMTTENVSFRIRNALLSRMRVVELTPLSDSVIEKLILTALKDSERGLGDLNLEISLDALSLLARLSMGDARRALTALEWASSFVKKEENNLIDADIIKESFSSQPIRFSQDGDEHYENISAFIKSLRGSDPDAALYYMLRALKGGEDPLFITRRMIIFASEDAGCDPRALEISLNVDAAVNRVGMPEAKIAMSQGVVYLACCSKSNASYVALNKMEEIVSKYPDLEIPKKLKNAPTELMKSMGNKEGYHYPHDYEGGFVPETYLPSLLKDVRVYHPTNRGLESKIKQRLEYYRELIKKNEKEN